MTLSGGRLWSMFALAILLAGTPLATTSCNSCMPDLSPKKDRWKLMLTGIQGTISSMTVAPIGVLVGGASGRVELLGLDGSSSLNKSIYKGPGHYNGPGTPYQSTIKAIGLNAAHVVFAGIEGAGIYRNDSGQSWSDTFYGLAPDPVNVAAIATADSGTMFAASNSGVYRIDSPYMTWTRVYAAPFIENLSAIAIDSSDGAIYVGHEKGVLKSTDNGDTWAETALPNSTKGNYPLTMVVDMNVFGSTIFALTPQTLFESMDHGSTWVEDVDSLTFPGGRDFTCLALRGGIGPDIFIGSSTTGVTFKKWASMLSGFTTDSNSNGLYTRHVYACGAYQNGQVYLGTDNGAFMEIN